MTVTSSVDVNKLVCHYEENIAQLNAARTQAENSREPQKSLRLSKKVPKGAVPLLNGNMHKDALRALAFVHLKRHRATFRPFL